ncbi:MAG: YjgN family protein [Magnetospirillum sp.]
MSHRAFSYDGQTGPLVRLSVVNFLLNIVTLSLWRFWGKTQVRSYLWGRTRIWNEPLEYVGRGGELFIGFLIALLVVFAPYMAVVFTGQMLVAGGQPAGVFLIVVAQIVIFFLIGVGLYRARRYLMTRTVWRGLRAGQDGSAMAYALLTLGHVVLLGLTLGWSGPWMSVKLDRYLMNNTRFGDTGFECEARSAPLYKRYAALWFSFIPVMVSFAVLTQFVDLPSPDRSGFLPAMVGIYTWVIVSVLLFSGLPLAAYHAAYWRNLAAHTRFDGIGFGFDMGTWRLVRLFFGNMLITIFSLGILRPLASQRTLRAACEHLTMESAPDINRMVASPQAVPRTGEGLVAALDGIGEF